MTLYGNGRDKNGGLHRVGFKINPDGWDCNINTVSAFVDWEHTAEMDGEFVEGHSLDDKLEW